MRKVSQRRANLTLALLVSHISFVLHALETSGSPMTVNTLQVTQWYIKDGSPALTFLLLFKTGEIRSSHSSNCLTKLPAILQAKNTVREIKTQAIVKSRKNQ